MKPPKIENMPLIHPSCANAKTHEHKIYANEEGLRLLIDMCHQVMSSGERMTGAVMENGESVNIEIIPSTQADFDCGGNALGRIKK